MALLCIGPLEVVEVATMEELQGMGVLAAVEGEVLEVLEVLEEVLLLTLDNLEVLLLEVTEV